MFLVVTHAIISFENTRGELWVEFLLSIILIPRWFIKKHQWANTVKTDWNAHFNAPFPSVLSYSETRECTSAFFHNLFHYFAYYSPDPRRRCTSRDMAEDYRAFGCVAWRTWLGSEKVAGVFDPACQNTGPLVIYCRLHNSWSTGKRHDCYSDSMRYYIHAVAVTLRQLVSLCGFNGFQFHWYELSWSDGWVAKCLLRTEDFVLCTDCKAHGGIVILSYRNKTDFT